MARLGVIQVRAWGIEATMKKLEKKIAETKRTRTPKWGMTVDGYSKRCGAPTHLLIRLEGEKRFRRLMCWQFSNVGTCFLRIQGEDIVVSDHLIPN